GATTGARAAGALSAWGASACGSAVAAAAPPNIIAAAIAAPAPARPARETGVTVRMARRWVWCTVFDTKLLPAPGSAPARGHDLAPCSPVRGGASGRDVTDLGAVTRPRD